MSFVWRFVSSLALVVATYNPTGYSYFHWVWNSWEQDRLGPEHFVAGMLVVAGWAILVVATRRSLGSFGLLIVAAILGGVVWWLSSAGLQLAGTASALTWVILVCVALLLTVGLSWSHIWRRITGQYEVDDNDV
jgi:hypothetical protein